VPIHSLTGVDPFLLLNIVAPLLYGLNVAGVYWVGRKMLNWNSKTSLLAGCFFAVQLASLRISWDLFRNTLGMGLLLFTLPLVGKMKSKWEFGLFAILSFLVVVAHEYSAVALLAIVSGLALWNLIKKKQSRVDLTNVSGVLPALSVFLVGLFLRINPVKNAVTTNVIGTPNDVSGRFFFFANYLNVKDAVFHYPAYWNLAVDVFALFALLYLPYLLLVRKGFFRNSVLDAWTGLLLVGAFGCLLSPFLALDFWDRWMFMLVYPFTFYAVNGLAWLFRNFDGGSLESVRAGLSSKKAKAMIALTVLLGSAYLATPVLMSTVNIGVFSISPASAHFSSAPTVPYQDVDGVAEAMAWLNENMNSTSCVVLYHAFLPWGQYYLDKTNAVVRFVNDVGLATETAFSHGFRHVFFVWWNQNIGWYGMTVPDYFIELKDFGRISVYGHR
jgi:hypothetical protein